MGYSIDEAIEDGEKRHLFLMALKETYPDATLSQHRWESSALTVEDCDGFEVDVEKGPLGQGYARAKLYRKVNSGRVYMRSFTGGVSLEPMFHHMMGENPELFAQLLAWVKENA